MTPPGYPRYGLALVFATGAAVLAYGGLELIASSKDSGPLKKAAAVAVGGGAFAFGSYYALSIPFLLALTALTEITKES